MVTYLLSFSQKYCQVDRVFYIPRSMLNFLWPNKCGCVSRLLRVRFGPVNIFLICAYCLICNSFVLIASVPSAPKGLVWESSLASDGLYNSEVEALIQSYESEVGQRLQPSQRKKVGLKINTRGRGGLNTPLNLIRALVDTLEARGYDRGSILIIDDSTYNLREAGIMPPLSQPEKEFEGCPVLALDSDQFYDPDWYYDSPLPASFQTELQLMDKVEGSYQLTEGSHGRKSFLPMPLILEVDFWINLAVGTDDPSLGVDGALANATLWNVSNSRRFLVNQATASAAVAEISAIPEMEERLVLHFISLDRYQFIGGPFFNSIYTRSEPRIWMSSDPVALDRLIYERINAMRLLEGFPEIKPVPQQLAFAASLGLGEDALENIKVRYLSLSGDAEPEDRMIQSKEPLK